MGLQVGGRVEVRVRRVDWVAAACDGVWAVVVVVAAAVVVVLLLLRPAQGSSNFLGLHGNAILAKCSIYDPVIYRDEIGPYFSDKASFTNADGFEKRLGGRMALLARISLDLRTSVVAGATRKLENFVDEIRQCIGYSTAIIGGDQDCAFCKRVDLRHVDNQSHATWPASCATTGTGRGDILCSYLNVLVPEQTTVPCLRTTTGVSIRIGDHAISSVTLQL